MTWVNWAGNQRATPARVVVPASTAEVAESVAKAASDGLRVKAVGSGHSFTGAAATDGLMIDLRRLSGIVAADTRSGRVRVLGGTPLHVLNPALDSLGLALPNLGDIDRQTIAGAVATGTHGTGARQQGLAAGVTGLTLVTAAGSVLRCSADPAEDPDAFHAARVGLGAFGVVTEVELQGVPAFRLHAREGSADLDELLDGIDEDVATHDHVDIHWFPHTTRCLVKRSTRLAADDPAPAGGAGRPLPRWRARLDDDFLANTVFEGVNRVGARWPASVRSLNQVAARVLGAREFTDTSWRVLCSAREVRFTESEYAVPRAAFVPVVRELRAWFQRTGWPTTVPVELRFAAADEVWLSTAHGRDTAYVAVHQYHRRDGRPQFAALEAIAREHEGRPHWGKLHGVGAADLRRLYPRFDDALAVRDRIDPDRVFGNDYLERVLGP